MLSVLFTVGIIAAVALWLGASYRRTVHRRMLVTFAWKRLDELVKQRIDIVGKTLDVARNAGIEGAELDRLIRAHGRATPYRGPADAATRTAQIDHALTALLSLMGQHPAAGGAMRAISEDLATVTQGLGAARDEYNERAAAYNRTIRGVPGNVVAGMAGFHRAEPFT